MPRADLRLADLQEQSAGGPAKLMNVKVPVDVADAIDGMVATLGCTKTAVVIALMNEGLDAFAARRDEFPRVPGPRAPRRGRPALPPVEHGEQP